MRRVGWAMGLLLLAGCALRPPESETETVWRWPPPPDPARVAFVAQLAALPDLVPRDRLSQWRRRLSRAPLPTEPLFVKPYDVAAAAGQVVVSDTAGGRVLLLDLPGRAVRVIDGGARPLRHPLGVALDGRGRIYVVDGARALVRLFDPWGHDLLLLGAGHLRRPRDVAVSADGERIYVLDVAGPGDDAHHLVVLDRTGGEIARWGGRGRAPGRFNMPNQVAVAANGEVVVLDAGNFRVQVFTADGRPLRQFGSLGRGLGQFARPRGLAVDGTGRIYVTDAAFQNYQIFDAMGRLLLPVGQGGGSGPGRFALPAGIAVDERGFIYVADQLFRHLSVFRLLEAEQD